MPSAAHQKPDLVIMAFGTVQNSTFRLFFQPETDIVAGFSSSLTGGTVKDFWASRYLQFFGAKNIFLNNYFSKFEVSDCAQVSSYG